MATDITLPIKDPLIQVLLQREEPTVDETLLYIFKTFFKRYKKQMSTEETYTVPEGIQQHLPERSKELTFNDLPVYVKLQVFSNLDAVQLCRISRVSKEWYTLTSDNLLWGKILERDIRFWNVIGHQTNPGLYIEVESEWSNKEIYLRCSPHINYLMREDNALISSLTNMIRYFLPKKTPKIAMFGPGLESGTSSIVQKILYTQSKKLERVGLVPGQFDGVGSGWCLKMQNGQVFQLSVLYSASKKDRLERRNRLQNNSLLEVRTANDGAETLELTPAVRDFCRTVDAFIYVVDASKGNSFVKEDKAELFAMVNERWSATHVPILVMSCIPSQQHQRVPCVDVVQSLEISAINRPWQVHDIEVDTLDGVIPSIQWLVEQSQRR